MVSGTPPNPSSYNASYIDSRRAFISRYLEYVGSDAVAKWDDCLKMAFEQVMKSLEERGRKRVSHDWLEYEADRVAWQKLFSEIATEAVEWPFTIPSKFDAPNKIAEGISPTYQNWRLARGLRICDVSDQAPHDAMPEVPSLEQRNHVWKNDPNYPSEMVAPITGPFQIALPLWIDLYNLVFGEHNQLLEEINNEIVPPHLEISWIDDDQDCITLVVGFSRTTCVNPGSEGIGDTIRCLWQSVVDWAIEAYYGGTISLATFLRVRKAMPVVHSRSYHSSRGLTSMTSSAYAEVQSEALYSIRKAHEKRNFIAECRAEILEILEKPLAEAKTELSRWVLRGYSSEVDERVQVAREIWVSSTTDERTIQEAFVWSWGPHDMATISVENPSAESSFADNDSSMEQ
ncbi:hypothetical protein J7337_009265 [Fusarium musae]|uniref:Uncharacterized protein n=1 Tax=Fusarium musae TaxID=1042133 RepID=A0A9P8DAQ0_9HYPO|nr:hypothetical protein J7337_009265 [Fusarium musae]KAG9498460.1 hypothetical protein J7337_009265 [Fusarium musae]